MSQPTLTKHLAKDLPDMLYHYTSAEALLGIIEHSEMWCTEVLYMNDATESTHAVQLLRELLLARIESELYPKRVCAFLAKVAATRFGTTSAPVFVASFTELPDALSQWRAYTPSSGGYAVGLSGKFLKEAAQYLRFAECIYDLEKQKQVLNEIIDPAISYFTENFPDADENDSNPVVMGESNDTASIVRSILGQVIHFAPLMKHAAFAEEKEWRIIMQTITGLPAGLGFRTSPKGIVPFQKLKLPITASGASALAEPPRLSIRIGPSLDTANRARALEMLLMSKRVWIGKADNTKILFSAVPYKNW